MESRNSEPHFRDMDAKQPLTVIMKIWEESKNDKDAEYREIDSSKLWKIAPMRTKLSNESLAHIFFLFGKAIYESDDAERDVNKNIILAVRFFRYALKKGERKAAFFLGELHYKGQGVIKNHADAFKFYQESLRMDHQEPLYGESLHRIGWCLGNAHGTEMDEHESKRYYRLSYEAGSGNGARQYGWALFHGKYMRKDTKKGFQIMLEAKAKGIKDVYLHLADCYAYGIEVEKQSPTKAYELTKEAYDAGGEWAAETLAIYYETGFGVEKNLQESARIYHETYKKGGREAVDAQAHYGHCLIRGRGVEKNAEQGFKLLRGACRDKWSAGWILLGDCYRHGYGIKQNYETAVVHYNRAIANNVGVAMVARTHLTLGDMKAAGQGLSKMDHDTFYYYKYAADNFNADAQMKLGQMFLVGKGVGLNVTRAFEYFKQSARGGHIEAQNKAGMYLGDILERPRISAASTIEEAAGRGD